MKPSRLSSTTLSFLLVWGAAACGDDGGSSGDTDASTGTPTTETNPSATAPSTSPTTAPSTNPTDTASATTDASTSSATETSATTGTSDPDTGSDSTGDPMGCPYTPIDGKQTLGFELVAGGFNEALLVVGDPVDTDVLYVVQKRGQIKRLEPGATEAPQENWYEVSVEASSELGLLGLAFHPDYAQNGLMYVVRSEAQAPGFLWRLTEYQVGDDGSPDLGTAREVFASAQPAPNHNGGMIQFGPDGLLYASVGDGGPQNDGCGNGQNTSTHNGTIVRINVEADGTPDSATACGTCGCPDVGGFDFTIPDDNPFVGDDAVRDEIYAYGFRNPWRFSFDPVDDRLYVADVGQGDREEVTVVEPGSNHGWGDMEGATCFADATCDTNAAPGATNADGLVLPIADYPHSGGRCSITGLGNYRSCEVPGFDGVYFYGDLCTGEIWGVTYDGTTAEATGPIANVPDNMSPWGGGYNAFGDVFIAANPNGGGAGSIYRLTAAQ